MSVAVTRPTHIAERIVLLDGLTGTGKTMVGPLMGSLTRIEILRLEHVYEYLCVLDMLGKMERDAASAMVTMFADLACYNTMISREVNFRPSDLSGVFSNPHSMRYLRRLFKPDGAPVMERISSERPVLQVLTHQALPALGLAFDAFGDRLRVVEMVRHPLYLLEHTHSYIERHGTDPRDFTIWIDHEGHALPWFVLGWEDLWLSSSAADKVIYATDWLLERGRRTVEGLSDEQRERYLEVPFEGFVLDTDAWVDRICGHVGVQRTELTPKVMRKQKVPRTLVAAGPDKSIYRRYAWSIPEPGATEQSVYESKRAWAAENASKAAVEVLDRMSEAYESRWGLWFT